jgi:hypothetical protein
VQAGVLPAYDEALKLIRADSEALKNEVEDVRKKLASAQGEEAEALQKKVEILEVQSEINLPDVRWKFRNGLGTFLTLLSLLLECSKLCSRSVEARLPASCQPKVERGG